MNRILVNPALLTWARERAGLDALALARRFPRLTKCEDGQLPTHSDRRPHRIGHGSFRSVFTPAISKTDRARARIPTLADLRGMLLPKLIFGELRLRDAKRFLKERGL